MRYEITNLLGDSFLCQEDDTFRIGDKNPKFRIDDFIRKAKCKNISAKGYTPNWSEEIFVIKKPKNTVQWTYTTNQLNGENFFGTFYKK